MCRPVKSRNLKSIETVVEDVPPSVDLMLEEILMKLNQKHSSLRLAFRHIDADGDGKVSCHEFETAICGLGLRMTPDQARDCFKALDVDGDGYIDFSEFGRLNA